MPLYQADQYGTFIHAEAYDLEKRLMDFDNRLYLKYRVVKHPTKDILGRRYEVWRHTEEGEMVMIGHWRLEEFGSIENDIRLMRAAVVGGAPTAEQQMDAGNEAVEKQNSTDFRDSMGDMLEHATKLWHDTNNPRNWFGGGTS